MTEKEKEVIENFSQIFEERISDLIDENDRKFKMHFDNELREFYLRKMVSLCEVRTLLDDFTQQRFLSLEEYELDLEKGTCCRRGDKKMSETKRYVICRTYSAGVFVGYLEYRIGKEAKLSNARRVWQWTGAASLSELAEKGTATPETCKWPMAVKSVELTEVIEVLDVSPEARLTYDKVKVWTAH